MQGNEDAKLGHAAAYEINLFVSIQHVMTAKIPKIVATPYAASGSTSAHLVSHELFQNSRP